MSRRFKRDLFTDETLEVDDGSENGRSLLYKEPVSPHLVQGRAGQTRAITDAKPHISKSLGVPCAQVDRFNAELENHGVTDARYSKKDGFLHSTSDDGRLGAWAIRGHFNPDGGQLADRYGNALGF